MNLIDRDSLLEKIQFRIEPQGVIGATVRDMVEKTREIILAEPTVVDAYTEEQVASILEKVKQLEISNQELETEYAWLKSCLNCKIRRECPRHCGKVVHDCDHWEYGDNAVEVVHGEWFVIEDDYFDLVELKCSVCGESWGFEDYEDCIPANYHYCPNCGAKMDGDGNV